MSAQIHALFARYTTLIQPLSLDEAYLDVTAPLLDRGSPTAIAAEIRAAIRAETGLTASAGVSYNKFLAKLASDHRKPDGLFVITPKMGPAVVEGLPVGKFHGVGPVTAAKMNRLGIHTGFDLRAQSLDFLAGHFGKATRYYHGVARGHESKRLVAAAQVEIVRAQVAVMSERLRWCEDCRTKLISKGYYPATFRSLFGNIAVRVRRLCACRCKADVQGSMMVSALATNGGIAPELAYVTARFAALVPFAKDVGASHRSRLERDLAQSGDGCVDRDVPLSDRRRRRTGLEPSLLSDGVLQTTFN